MKRRLSNVPVILLVAAHAVAGTALLATLTPGGITLGVGLLGLGALIGLAWVSVRCLLQIRELLGFRLLNDHRQTTQGNVD